MAQRYPSSCAPPVLTHSRLVALLLPAQHHQRSTTNSHSPNSLAKLGRSWLRAACIVVYGRDHVVGMYGEDIVVDSNEPDAVIENEVEVGDDIALLHLLL